MGTEVWVTPAQTDTVYNTGVYNNQSEDRYIADRQFGFAKMTVLRTFSAWKNSKDYNYDFAWLTLNRRIGERTGWMGLEVNRKASELSFNGYPKELPYVPSREVRQYPGIGYPQTKRSGLLRKITGYTPHRIKMNAYKYGGHSGGPVWRTTGTNDFRIQGINSSGNRMGYSEATRITFNILQHTANIMAIDSMVRPPIARPDLNELASSTEFKDLRTNSAARGGSISVEYNVYNSGTVATTASLDFYLSEDNQIESTDHHIGTRSFSLAAHTYANPITTLTIPTVIRPGKYYVGWIMSSSVTEYPGTRDWAVIGPEQLTIEIHADKYKLYRPKGGLWHR